MTAHKRNIVLRLSSKEARVLSEGLSDLSVGGDPVVARISKALARAIDSPEEISTTTPQPKPPERIIEHHYHESSGGCGGEMVLGDHGPEWLSPASAEYLRRGDTW